MRFVHAIILLLAMLLLLWLLFGTTDAFPLATD